MVTTLSGMDRRWIVGGIRGRISRAAHAVLRVGVAVGTLIEWRSDPLVRDLCQTGLRRKGHADQASKRREPVFNPHDGVLDYMGSRYAIRAVGQSAGSIGSEDWQSVSIVPDLTLFPNAPLVRPR